MDAYDDVMQAAANSAPTLDPSATVPIAQATGDVVNAATVAQGTAGLTQAQAMRRQWEQQTSSNQAAMWKAATPTEQQMLSAAGYKPPKAHSTGLAGVLHSAIVDAGSVAGHVAGAIGGVVKTRPVHDTLNAVGAPLRAEQHILRSAESLEFQANPSNVWSDFGANVAATLSPHEWAQAWKRTSSGEQTFMPDVVARVQKQYGPQISGLAQRLASAPQGEERGALAAILKTVPADQQQGLVNQFDTDPNLKDAVRELQAGKMSLGRAVVGADFLYHNPLAGRLLSGGIDATFDWFGDPVMALAKSAKGFQEARYLVKTPDDVQRLYESRNAVQRAFNDLGQRLADKDYTSIMDRYPRLVPLLGDMARSDITTGQGVADYLAGQVSKTALLQGNAPHAAVVLDNALPHLSWAGQARLAAKGALSRVVDFAADTPFRQQVAQLGVTPADTIEGVQQVGAGGGRLANLLNPIQNLETGVGRVARAATTIVPYGASFDPNAGQAPQVLRNLLLEFVPKARADELVNAFVDAPTLGLKRDIYLGAVKELHVAAGLGDTPEGLSMMNRFMDGLKDSVSNNQYSTGGIDAMLDGEASHNAGLLENQLTTKWDLPAYKDLVSASRQVSLSRSLFGIVNNGWVEALMQRAWKPLTLLRLGFPVRAGGEEVAGYLAREGLPSYLRAMAGNAAAGLRAGGEDDAAGVVGRLISHLPQAAQRAIETPQDLMAAVVGDPVKRALAGTAGKFAGDEVDQAVRELVDGGYMDGAFKARVSAGEGRAAGYNDDAASVAKLSRNGKVVRVRFAPTGAFRGISRTELSFNPAYANRLDEIANSEWARTALEHADAPAEERLGAVADKLEASLQWQRSERAVRTSDGRYVATGDVTSRQAALDHADKIAQHVDALVRSPDGQPIPGLADYLLGNRKSPSLQALAEIPSEKLPTAVSGPDLMAMKINPVQSMIESGFDHLVGRPMDIISRQPIFVGNYVNARREGLGLFQELARQVAAEGGDPAQLERAMTDLAVERAMNRTIPFIHDPQIRSQLAVTMRNLMPFWFAQEQFYKRWARTLAYAPQTFREAQLLMSGIRHSGVVHTDPTTGAQYFLYPAVGATQDLMSKMYETVTGHKATLPIPANLRGEIQFLTPGTERLGLPSFGPLVSVPLNSLAARFPELTTANANVLGARGSGRSFIDQILPTSLSRIVHYQFDKPSTSPQMASAMMQAIQYLDATGHPLPENATPLEKQNYFSRVENWTRTIMLTRAVFGFGVPASPELQISPDGLNNQLSQLMSELPYNQAVAQFMKENPDATAYTVFQSQSESGAPLPATTQAMGFMADNKSFLEAYPYAGAWFIPASDNTGKFDRNAYAWQMAEHMRTRKDPKQFWLDIVYARDAPTYFEAEDYKNKMLKGLKGVQATKYREQWTKVSQQYLATHPVFAQGLNGTRQDDPLGYTGAQLRTETLNEVQKALADPRLPSTPQTQAISDLVESYQVYQAMLSNYAGQRSSVYTRLRQGLERNYAAAVTQYVTANPDVQGLYLKLIRPEISTGLRLLGD